MRLDSYNMAHHFFRQFEVNLAVRECGVREKRSQDTLEVTHRIAHILSNIIHYFIRERDTIPMHLAEQDIFAQEVIRLLDFGGQAPFESRKEAFFNIFQLNRRSIAGQNKLLAAHVEKVEYLEEGILRAFHTCEVLDIIHNQHIDRLVEIQEVGYSIVSDSGLVL